MAPEVLTILRKYETLMEAKKIVNYTISLQKDVLLVSCNDGNMEQKVEVDKEMLLSLHLYFFGVDIIQYNSFDYISLVSIINSKMILERMLRNNTHTE